MNLEKILPWAVIGAGGLLAAKALNLGGKAADALASAGSAIGTGLYDFFHKGTEGETLFYTVAFPDNTYHAVPSSRVADDGIFRNDQLSSTYKGDGKMYRIVIKKSDPRGVNKYAVPV